MKKINLALQGGGAHGAFTWGVLDRLLDEKDIEIAAISATSAGALNGAAFKAGWANGGREGARKNLDWLWKKMGALDDPALVEWMSLLSPPVAILSRLIEMSPQFVIIDAATRIFSPYSFGALYQNPLESLVNEFRFSEVCGKAGPDLYICATNVRSGKIRVFSGSEISTDVILASACLPSAFQAVEFKDPKTKKTEAFWDGGFTGNPALFPLFRPEYPQDIVIVNINPLHREELPKTPQEIQNRINEISFNSSLFRELRAVQFVRRLIEEGKITNNSMKNVLIHMIADDDLMNDLSVATKTIPNPLVLQNLKVAGQKAASNFLSAHGDSLNTTASVDLDLMFN